MKRLAMFLLNTNNNSKVLMATKRDNPLYDDIWSHIKKHGKCKIAAHPALHKRIIHAVINKKYYDLSNKLELAESKRFTKLVYTRTTNQIIFNLITYHEWNMLTTEDL